MATKLEAIVEGFGLSEEEARAMLIDAGEDPDEECPELMGSAVLSLAGTALKGFQDAMYRKTFGEVLESAQGRGACVNCKQEVHNGPEGEKGAVYSNLGWKEYSISGVCETCFDAMFREPEEDDDDAA